MTGVSETGPEEYASEAAGLSLFPVFLVIDVSASMAGARIQAANEMVPAILDVCLEDPSIGDALRLGVITFNDTASVQVPFGSPTQIATAPVFTATRGTSYSAAFRLLRSEVQSAMVSLRSDGYTQLMRPTVFFITDGEPIDKPLARDEAFSALTDASFIYAPNIFMFGVGEAQANVLEKYTSRKGFAAINKGEAADGLRKLIPSITNSIVQSLASVGDPSGPRTIFDPADLDPDWSFLNDD